MSALYTAPSAPGGQVLSYQRQTVLNNNSQIQSETLGGANAGVETGTQPYTYNRRGEIKTWISQASVTTNYTYDLAGNRTGAGAATFTYDPQNRLTAGGGKTYSWSDRGTMLTSTVTASAAVTTVAFGAYNQNLSSTSAATGTVTMTYDGLGRIATRNGTQFKYNGTGIDPISDGTWTTAQNPAGQTHATKDATAGSARWAMGNTHDDLGAWINPAGTGVDTTVGFDPFGVVTGRTGTLTPTGGFQGDWTDPTTNEVWMGARHYTPATGTFTSRDTYAGQLATPISLNRYTYAHGNPLNMVDPDGHAPVQSDYDRLNGMLKGINVGDYSSAQAYMTAVAGVVETYRIVEYLRLVAAFGVTVANQLAAMHAENVVDPVIEQGLRIAAFAWAVANPNTSTTTQPGSAQGSGSPSPKGVGTAPKQGPQLLNCGPVPCTPGWLPPEQVLADASTRSLAKAVDEFLEDPFRMGVLQNTVRLGCVDGSAGIGGGIGATVCLANDGLDAGTVTTVGAGGLIGIGVGYTLGAAATNATRLDQLKGRSMCATLSGELGQQAQGTMCLSMCASGSYTSTWTFYIGVGVGLGTPRWTRHTSLILCVLELFSGSEDPPSLRTSASTSGKERRVLMNGFPLAPTSDEPFTIWSSVVTSGTIFVAASRVLGRLTLTRDQLCYQGFRGPKMVERHEVLNIRLRKRWNGIEIRLIGMSGSEFEYFFWALRSAGLEEELETLGWVATKHERTHQ